MQLPGIGQIYQHYKRGGRYEIIGTARHSETNELLVVYKALYADEQFPLGQLWARPAAMFLEEVTPGTNRFKLVA